MRIPMPVLVSTALLASCAPSGGAEADAGPEPSVTMVGDTAFLDLPLGRSADNGEITVRFEAVDDPRYAALVEAARAGRLDEAFAILPEVDRERASMDPQLAALRADPRWKRGA